MRVELLDHMGTDLDVANAARVSLAKTRMEFLRDGDPRVPPGESSDESLLRFLARHDHWTPFAHTAIKFRVGAPVPIRTQCFKHKIGMVENEESRRYIKTTPELYVPDVFRKAPEGSVKQGSAGPHPMNARLRTAYKNLCMAAIREYEDWVANDVAPEQARFLLPQGVMVNWIWTGNLVGFANFYRKRSDPHAQKEVQEIAERVGLLIEPLFPHSWKALTAGGAK